MTSISSKMSQVDSPTVDLENVDDKDFDNQRDLKKEQLRRFIHDTHDRKWLAKWAVIAVSIWLSMVLLLLFFNQEVRLSDTVLVALLGTTTLNVLGLTFIVLRGHFGSSDNH